MTTILKSREPGDASVGQDRPSVSEIKETLRLILESNPFRTSKQCQDLLRYIVSQSLNADDSALKERVIGAEVFGREPAYDTNGDPVVRVRAADVRKRLAQYYQSLEPDANVVHIELQPGSYRAHFRCDSPPAASETPDVSEAKKRPVISQPGVKRRWFTTTASKLLLLAVGVAAIAGILLGIQNLWTSPQERFWAPLTNAGQPVLIYIGANVAYVFSTDYLAKYRAAQGLPYNGPEFFVDLPPKSSVRAEDLVPVKDTFVTTADVTAIVQLTTLFRDWKRPFMLRSGSDLSFGDLRNRPSVMIGAFNNPWTLEVTGDLPYTFQHGTEIRNRDHPDHSWSRDPKDPRSGETDDYALISRLISSKTGGPVVTVAGIGEYGTQAAAEFLTNPEKMRDFLKNAPRGWESKNMQAVLHVKAIGYQPVAVEVVATSYW